MAKGRRRWGVAAVAGLATAALYAEGVLRNGWIEVFLLAPILWYLVAPESGAALENLLLSLAALCLTIAATDLILRPMLGVRLHATPMNAFTRKLPRLPSVARWDPQVAVTVETFGDLAAMMGDTALRETRTMLFQTDSAGFRNADVERPVDVVILGDSFGAGAGTTQGKVLSQILQTQYGWSTYNLSFPACGPWQQYINLAIEAPRLKLTRKTTVLWLLYTGNDLDDEYGDTWKLEELPWRSGFSAWKVSYKTFRGRSPLHQLAENLSWRIKRSPDMAKNVEKRHLPDGRPVLFLKGQEEWGGRSRAQVEQHHNFPKLMRTMEAMKQWGELNGPEIAVVVLPTKGEVYPSILHGRPQRPEDFNSSGFFQAVHSICNRISLPCVDAKPYLMETAGRLWAFSGELLWWRDDTHLDERGHEALAEFIAREIEPHRDLPIRQICSSDCRETER
ncbi:MAG: hypothetical protein ICV76_03090 [Nitrospiraceae bacterium]|nr:hypothetical protein [Nitrospiraceae bacterium]